MNPVVAVTPAGVKQFIQVGHQVILERSAGSGIGISDEEYRAAGAIIVDQKVSGTQLRWY